MNAITQALLWLDANTARFWITAWSSFVLLLVAAFLPSRRADRPVSVGSHVLFGFGVLVTLSAFRWPIWFHPTELNPDEAQTIAGAITLNAHPLYWRDVGGTTHGPWCEYLLLIAHWLGAPLNYVTARVVTTLLQAGSVLATWGTLRCFTTERVARVSVLPALAFWSFVSWDDFVHYSSELPGISLLAVAGWLTALTIVRSETPGRQLWLAGLAGFCLGNVPFAKLQSVPQALAMVLVTLALWWWGKPNATPLRLVQRIGAYIAGGVLPALIVGAVVLSHGIWQDFYIGYVGSAMAYTSLSEDSLVQMPSKFFHVATTEPGFAWYFWGSGAFALVYLRTRVPQKAPRIAIVVGWLLVGAAYYSVLAPGRKVAHYLQLLVAPTSLLVGFSLAAAVKEAANEPQSPWRNAAPWLMLVLLTLAPQIYHRSIAWHRFVGSVRDFVEHPPSEAAQYIKARSEPGAEMAMWGWGANLLVETGMPHGTREANSSSQLAQWRYQNYYIERYVEDLKLRNPSWFVDVVGMGAFVFEDRRLFAHEAIPAVANVVAERYDLVAEFKNLRVYHRKDAPRSP